MCNRTYFYTPYSVPSPPALRSCPRPCNRRPLQPPSFLWITVRLFPSLPGNPQAGPPLCLQTQVKNRSHRNVLRDRIISYGDVRLIFFQPRRLHGTFQRGVMSSSIPSISIVASLKSLSPPCGGNSPRYGPSVGLPSTSLIQKNYALNHRQVKIS